IEADSMGAALGGVMITSLLLAALGLLVARIGTSWITLLMPRVVMGSIVALIGFNLAPTAYEYFQQSAVTATVTLFAVMLCTALCKGMPGRVSELLAMQVDYGVAVWRGEAASAGVA